MREHIQHLCRRWLAYNDEYFGGELVPTVLAFEEPGHTTCYGEYSSVSMFGGSGQIMIRPSLLAGTLQHFRKGNKNKEGMRRFTEQVLLHEMIHQWQHEVAGTPPVEHHNYGGHGATFSAKANEIGGRLGFPPVRLRNKKSHSRDTADLPNPGEWPHNVCPQEYYLGAYVPVSPDAEAKLREHLSIVLRRHGIEKVRRTTDEIWQAIEEARKKQTARVIRVINIKYGEPYDIYIGREMKRGRYALECSPWHNTFKVGEDGTLEEVLKKYERYLREERPDLMARLPELEGKTLACWCAPKGGLTKDDPLVCHGQIPLRLLDELDAAA